jgi:hypothetical protein
VKQDTKRKITVEDLFALKRAERPAPEFWAHFESDMRAKQLAAIVGRRSFSDVFSSLFAVIYRRHLPLGAAAAVALTWTGVHYMRLPSAGVHVVVPASSYAQARVAEVVAAPAARVSEERAAAPAQEVRSTARDIAPQPAAIVIATGSHVMPAPVVAASDSPPRTPFSDVVAVTLADFRESQPDLSRRDVFGSDREFESAVAPVRQPAADPLARLDPVSEERRSRLLATALPSYSSSADRMLASARVKGRDANDRMYESMDPYGRSAPMSLEFKF